MCICVWVWGSTRVLMCVQLHKGVVVCVQVPLAEGGVAIPFPLCFPFSLRGSLLHRLKREMLSFKVLTYKHQKYQNTFRRLSIVFHSGH